MDMIKAVYAVAKALAPDGWEPNTDYDEDPFYGQDLDPNISPHLMEEAVSCKQDYYPAPVAPLTVVSSDNRDIAMFAMHRSPPADYGAEELQNPEKFMLGKVNKLTAKIKGSGIHTRAQPIMATLTNNTPL
jgi:hypothetical protein